MTAKGIKINYRNVDIFYNEDDDVWYGVMVDKFKSNRTIYANKLKDAKEFIDANIKDIEMTIRKNKENIDKLNYEILILENIMDEYLNLE